MNEELGLSGKPKEPLRPLEHLSVSVGNSTAETNVKWREAQLPALLALCQILFVLGILTIGTLIFMRDATVLVIRPVEAMVKRVNAVAKKFQPVVGRAIERRGQ